MGIENFFNTINRHTLFQNNITSSSVNEPITNITKGMHIFFDFNSIIYNIIQDIEYELNYTLYEIITGHNTDDKFKYITKYLSLLENYDNFNIGELNLELFKEIFTSSNINTILIKLIKNKVIEVLSIYNDPQIVENIFISIDGTPNMPKIMEQKKRRYNQYIIDELKNNIKEKYIISFDENRKIFEDSKIYVERTAINAATSFMQNIYAELISEEFKQELSKLLPKLMSYKVSSPNEKGEGEKKIFEEIVSNSYDGSYVIISPDADLIILCLIQKNMLNKKNIPNSFNIIRTNTQNETIDNISIDRLMDCITEHIVKRISESKLVDFVINNNRIIDDITLLLSLFGNDFMPRLKSLNVRNGFNIIFEVYIRHITRTRNRYKYITFEEDNLYKINYDNFNSFLYKISENEHKLCIETFASSHYKNYGYINSNLDSTYGSPYFYDKLNAYIHGFNKLMTHIVNYKKNNIEKTGEEIYEELLSKYSDRLVFTKQFVTFEAGISDIKDPEDIKLKTIEHINKIIIEIKTYNFYRNKLKFNPYSYTINDKYHQKMIRENMSHPLMLITEYDNEIYKLEKKLDEYHFMFSSDIDSTLGSIEIVNRHGFYKLIYDNNIEKNKQIYYEQKMNIKTDQEKNKLAHAYITGLFWTFDFYFNKNQREINTIYISTWSYEYDSSPFISDIIRYMDTVYNRNKMLNHIFYSINNNLSSYYVPHHLFMNELEQYIFINPYEKIKNKVNEKYLVALCNANFFTKCETIVKGILSGKSTDYIDAGKSAYLNKCTIIGMKKMSFSDYMNIVMKLRDQI
jgi:5'-3' exonuclease